MFSHGALITVIIWKKIIKLFYQYLYDNKFTETQDAIIDQNYRNGLFSSYSAGK